MFIAILPIFAWAETPPATAPKSPPTAATAAATQRPALPEDEAAKVFRQGMALLDKGRNVEAEAVFRKLTEDRPELAEPWNNLAVACARQERFDEARAMLEIALRNNPNYASAHENLGDIYLRMASISYGKAIANAAAGSTAKTKLSTINSLIRK